ncbi:hypothetical protein MMC14_003796 [Varicellaria rhodocarpa]|nr:hypothetical protein [Varicellaria rhodocarpa]
MLNLIDSTINLNTVTELFGTCVRCFDKIQPCQTHISFDELNKEKARFVTWGQALGLDKSKQVDARLQHPHVISAIFKTMTGITHSFDEYKSEENESQIIEFEESELDDLEFEKSKSYTSGHELQPIEQSNRTTAVRISILLNSSKAALRRFRARLIPSQWRMTSTSTASLIAMDEKQPGLIQDLRQYIDDLRSFVGFPEPLTREQAAHSPEHIFAEIVREDDIARERNIARKSLFKGPTPFCIPDNYSPRTFRRILKELKHIQKYDRSVDKISAVPIDGNPFRLLCTICGPSDSPNEGGIFNLKLEFPPDYPFKPPKATFLTIVYHPNINAHGMICADLFTTAWSPSWTIAPILIAMISFLDDPNADEALDWAIANQYKNMRALFDETARLYTQKYAIGERV